VSRTVEPIYVKLSKLIVARREELGLTQAQLAKKTGISRAYIATMETGRQRIYLHHLLKMEKVLKSPLVINFVARASRRVILKNLKGCVDAKTK